MPKAPALPKHLITTVEAAYRAERSEMSIKRWIRAGKINAYRVNGRVLVDLAELEAIIAPEPWSAA